MFLIEAPAHDICCVGRHFSGVDWVLLLAGDQVLKPEHGEADQRRVLNPAQRIRFSAVLNHQERLSTNPDDLSDRRRGSTWPQDFPLLCLLPVPRHFCFSTPERHTYVSCLSPLILFFLCITFLQEKNKKMQSF